ncbi:HesA/MoeB/ThiF family protein [Alteromonas sp. H39]|uniref:HesA/MoeB/ThiF family protein n=1 Tax=Alteromonas sp. H39 TaxID=3389876 RepID=UPI0039E1AFFD
MPDPISVSQAMRYNRQIVLPQIDLSGQEALLNASVLVIGVGGLGNAAAMSLATSGVGSLTLADPDIVEMHNLPRQWLFRDDQIGAQKVDAACETLKQRAPDCRISTVAHTAANDDELKALIQRHDVVLDCTDNAHSRDQINRVSFLARKPLISGAAVRFEGQLFVSMPDSVSPCYACLRNLFEAPDVSCTEAGILSPVVSLVGLHQALLTVKLITGAGHLPIGQLMLFDALSYDWQTFKVPKQPECTVCSAAAPENK